MNIFNGKFGGGRKCINSLSFINDGLTEVNIAENILTNKNLSTFKEILNAIDDITKRGGTHVFN